MLRSGHPIGRPKRQFGLPHKTISGPTIPWGGPTTVGSLGCSTGMGKPVVNSPQVWWVWVRLPKCWTCDIPHPFWWCHGYQQLFNSPAAEDAGHRSLQEMMTKSSFVSIFIFTTNAFFRSYSGDTNCMERAQTTFIIIWTPGKLFFIHILFSFIHLCYNFLFPDYCYIWCFCYMFHTDFYLIK